MATHGFDTSFLVALEVAAHPEHTAARARVFALRDAGNDLALAPQVLAEFIHVVTDARRFSQPLSMDAALARAEAWWADPEVRRVLPSDAAFEQFYGWMRLHGLGRKRVLDTLLAATYRADGIDSVLTINHQDFRTLGMTTVGP